MTRRLYLLLTPLNTPALALTAFTLHALNIISDSSLKSHQILIAFGVHCQLHTHPHTLSFLRRGRTWHLQHTLSTFTHTHTHTHTLSPINCPFLSLLKHTHSRSSSAPVCLLTWPKLRSQNVNFLPWAVLVCFFLQHQKCLRSIAEFTVWQIYWLGQWVSVWAPLALI